MSEKDKKNAQNFAQKFKNLAFSARKLQISNLRLRVVHPDGREGGQSLGGSRPGCGNLPGRSGGGGKSSFTCGAIIWIDRIMQCCPEHCVSGANVAFSISCSLSQTAAPLKECFSQRTSKRQMYQSHARRLFRFVLVLKIAFRLTAVKFHVKIGVSLD